FMVIFFLLHRSGTTKGSSMKDFGKGMLFAVYLFGVFHFTGAGTIFNLNMYGLSLGNSQINFVPFSNEIDLIGYFLNIILFVPFGFLLPYIWPKTGSIVRILFSGIAFSLLIEFSQLFNNRRTDIDDLILNTIGALTGYILFKLFVRITRCTKQPDDNGKGEPALYIFFTFLGHFLLFNEFGLVKVLLGF
ncbi:MAG: VanZ family protein, partial [Lachnospiraceae bacterium]|nr:VanZ family protein [Lachnospiraceae bacterium]